MELRCQLLFGSRRFTVSGEDMVLFAKISIWKAE